MKKINYIILGIAAIASVTIAASVAEEEVPATPEYKVITIVESIVPMGLGRSRMIENKTEVNTASSTTERLDGKKSGQGQVRRRDLKVDEFSETKLLNFYSGVGINFQNIASNDAQIGARITELAAEGWELEHVMSGVESDSGGDDGKGIYITRLLFKR